MPGAPQQQINLQGGQFQQGMQPMPDGSNPQGIPANQLRKTTHANDGQWRNTWGEPSNPYATQVYSEMKEKKVEHARQNRYFQKQLAEQEEDEMYLNNQQEGQTGTLDRVVQSNTVQLKPASSVIHYPSAQIPYSDAKSQINQQAFVITKTFNQGIPQEVAEKQARYANS